MRWALTGTPGTGKTSTANRLPDSVTVVHGHDLLENGSFQAGYDHDRDTVIADIEALAAWLRTQPSDMLVESHLAHLLPVDRVIVLRCQPDELQRRLTGREATASVEENVEAERLDLILAESVDRHGQDAVFEVDTTDRDPAEVAHEIVAILSGDRPSGAGNVSFLNGQ